MRFLPYSIGIDGIFPMLLLFAIGCGGPPADRPGLEADADAGDDATDAEVATNDVTDGGGGDADSTASGGFRLQGRVAPAGGFSADNDFSLEGHVTTTRSARVCTGNGWTFVPSPIESSAAPSQ